MSWQLRGVTRTVTRGGKDVEIETDQRWTEGRNGVPLTRPYTWRGKRSRFAAITRSRIELGLAEDPDP
jgi:hypothetical protein